MMTIFGLVSTYREAKALVDELLGEGVDISDINVMVQATVAKRAMEDHVDFSRAGVAVTDEVGEQEYQGLDYLVAGEQEVELPGVGEIYAAGELATLMATTAMQARTEEGTGLESTLQEFSISASMAATYYEGVAGAGWLIFIRVDDDSLAKSTMPTFRRHTQQIHTVG